MAEEIVTAERFAHSLGDKVLACRELGHTWRPFAVEPVIERRAIRGFVRVMRCSQCRTERHQTLDGRGGIVDNRYRYPDGYLATNVEPGTYDRATFRLEAVTRWMERHETRKAS